jgi:serine/threonine protein kinase/tetratricopeptide (TPR) repeat protein
MHNQELDFASNERPEESPVILNPGQRLLHYRLIEKIGEGGMGVVWKALDTTLDREVAIKILPETLSHDAERLERFKREAKLLASLNHPNIASVHGLHESGGVHYIVMELVPGETLEQRLSRGALPVSAVLDVARQMAEGLRAAHERGVIHRDLKPLNIKVDDEGRVKLLDFGLAKLAQEESLQTDASAPTATQSLTREGAVMGTFPYMSPEQLSGRSVDARSDVFSLGVVLYRMTTGRLPFTGSGAELASAILRDTPPPVSDIDSRVPQELGELIQRCLAKSPGERPDDAGEVHNQLCALDQSTSARPTHAGASHGRRIFYAAIGFMVIAAAVIVLWLDRDRGTQRTGVNEARLVRLAVLPFHSEGPAEHEHFAEGITHELTDRLSDLKNLAVISQSSTMLYKDSVKNVREIGGELGADYILTGSVLWGDRDDPAETVRITPLLIRVSDEAELWSDRFESPIEDGASLQLDIAGRVASELDVTLSGEELGRLQIPPTKNALAYEAYLQGLQILPHGHGSEADFRMAETLFGQAVSLDGDFALAWVKLCEAHLGLYWFGYDATESRLQMAFDAVQRALQLDPDLPEVRFMLGDYYYRRRDYERALQEFSAVYEKLPNNSELLSHIAFIWRRQGLFEQCLGNQERALQLNPRDVDSMIELSHTLAVVGEYDRAIELSQKVIELDPENEWAYLLLSLAYWLRDEEGDLDRARAVLAHYPDSRSSYPAAARIGQELYEGRFEAAQRLISNLSVPALSMQGAFQPRALLAGLTFLAGGDISRARSELEEAARFLKREIEKRPQDHRLPSALGLAYAGLGRRDEAVRAGRRGMELLPYSTDALLSTQRIFDMACIHSLLGETDEALEYVKLLVSRPNDSGGAKLRLSPALANLRKDPRFWDLPPGYHVPRRRAKR